MKERISKAFTDFSFCYRTHTTFRRRMRLSARKHGRIVRKSLCFSAPSLTRRLLQHTVQWRFRPNFHDLYSRFYARVSSSFLI